jgi:PqqD family protein of HPr-rel-A system
MKWRNESRGRFYDANESTVVYFDSHSGDTHLLSDFAAHVLQQFDDQPLAIEELVDRISPTVEPEQVPDLTGALTGVLKDLTALDILKQE